MDECHFGIMIYNKNTSKWIMLPDLFGSKEEVSDNYRQVIKGHLFRVVAIDIKSQNMLY